MGEGEWRVHSNNQSGAVIRSGPWRSLLKLGSIPCNRFKLRQHGWGEGGFMLKACDPIGIHDNTAVMSSGTGGRREEERKERLMEAEKEDKEEEEEEEEDGVVS